MVFNGSEMRHVALPLNYARISSLLSHCGRERNHRLGASLHAAILKNVDQLGFHRDAVVVWNALVSMYAKCERLSDAAQAFDQMLLRDSISWNSVISGCLLGNDLEGGVWYFKDMQRSRTSRCDHASLTTVLSVYVEMELFPGIGMVHALSIVGGYQQGISVGNALMSAYFKFGCPSSARKVFDEMRERNVISWTAMISGLAQGLLCKESLALFQAMRFAEEANALTYSSVLLACSGVRALREGQQIHGLIEKSGFLVDVCVESALMDLYSKCSMMEDALQLFQACADPDEVCLTLVLVGLSQNGFEEKAINLFAEMVKSAIEIDANMFSAVLGAFGPSAPLTLGKQIHSMIIKKSLESNVFVSNGLINMYAKCGELWDSSKLFEQMDAKNWVSWNSIIAAFARHGHGSEALELYEQMKAEGMEPTDVTFLSLLHACSHIGSIEKGMDFLRLMYSEHRIIPRMEHYACVVDMLGRAGRLEDAKRFIENLPVDPDAQIWQALLGASSIHGDLEMGRFAAERLLRVAPACAAGYVLLANIYSSEGRWGERAQVIKRMKEMGVKKDTGASWIEVDREVHVFVVEDRVHRQAEIIYEVLEELAAHVRDQEHALHLTSLLFEMGLKNTVDC